MSSINDFNALFQGKQQESLVPSVPLTGFKFRLLSFDAYHELIQTGEKPDGSPKWAPSPDLVVDETGERVRCTLGLQLTDAKGLSTSSAAPFVDKKHYFTMDEVKALQARVGGFVTLEGARFELRDMGATTKKGFTRVETKPVFAFDSVSFD
jgi:hypothetical protein